MTDFLSKLSFFPKNFSYFSGFCQFPDYSENPKRFEKGVTKKFQRVVSLSSSCLDKCPPESSHISIPDTGDNGPIWRWFFTLSNLFRLVVVVSLERLFILNFLGMQYTLDKVGAKCPKEILQFCTLIWLKISLKNYSIYTWNNRVQLICTLGCN